MAVDVCLRCLVQGSFLTLAPEAWCKLAWLELLVGQIAQFLTRTPLCLLAQYYSPGPTGRSVASSRGGLFTVTVILRPILSCRGTTED